MQQLKGTGVALVTPFNAKHEVDYEALTRLVKHVTDGGVNYLVVMGTTGESVTLNKEEKKKIIAHVMSVNAGKLPIVLGIGGNNTSEILETIAHTDFTGITAILSVSPYYNKPTQEGIYQHYIKIADACPVPVILYNVPGRTSSNILPETTLRLSKHKNIIGIKEASGSVEQVMKIINKKTDDFMVISGDDALTLPFMAVGAVGVISVVANSNPKTFTEMVNHCLNADFIAAKKLHYELLEIIDLLFIEGNPGGVKAALKALGIMEDYVRLPLVNVSDATYNKLAVLMNK
ncbi:MAG: 4-hydroxy-tetrahydrodipicolinate synthase [Candidatus Woesearchaeota archaeon]|nr:MAG: 4-hydroxy-tetrahydrodipicolinate synthase [Candidatus Woesearchaeota archaeon]